ncbi:ATP-grasp domain-containing protein [Micrococcus sp. FDAARGOS_333]|uniref:ATP-grasp domain-containing protein n=1 Tax=Micrococcus sp. FDAARGOS_333 TaxID=1930558 RepID=UPI000C9E7EDF|nr:ATP-grasp domain-containing protein [Micrococcus sp. FDAARGOS_333]PNL17691.1 hypothetical protein CEQ11_005835 [Micrococcus sp. FDAARGOS_333]
MTTAILNRFPLDLVDYPTWLGHAPVLVTSRSSLPRTGLNLSAYRAVTVVDDYPSARTMLYLERLVREHECDNLLALSEFDLLRAARMRDQYGLGGPTLEQTLPFRDKLLMKRALSEAGVPVARFTPIDNVFDLLTFHRTIEGPIVVKPRMGASSIGVCVLRTEQDLDQFCLDSPAFSGDEPAYLIAEEFVENEMFNVDGVTADGRTLACWPSRTSSCLGFEEGQLLVASQLDADDERVPILRGLVTETIAALPRHDRMIFHAEVFLSPDGTYRLNEIGARIGGAKVRELVTRGFDFDPVEWYVRELFGEGMPDAPTSDVPARPYAYCLVPSRTGTVQAIDPGLLSSREGLDTVEMRIAVGDTLGPAASSIDGMALVVTHGDTCDEAAAIAKAAGEDVIAKVSVV